MTIYRQLLVLLWLTMVISLATVLAVNLKASSTSLQSQQQVNIDSALTALGMRLAPHLEPVDQASVDVTLNAAFDGAFYRRMTVEIFETEQMLERLNLSQPTDVPGWFIDLFDIKAYKATAPIASGWTESAEISIEGHPGFVYQQLWMLSRDLLILYGSLFVLIALLSSIGLRALIRPLNQIAHQAKAIEAKDFSYRVPVPRTLELQKVVSALNRLTDILNERFTDNANQLENLRTRLQQDSETGIANRRYLLNEFAAKQAEGESAFAVVMVCLQKADSIRKSYGYNVWIGLIKACVAQLQTVFSQPGVVIGRMSEFELAVLVPVLPSDDLTASLESLSEGLKDLHERDIAPYSSLFSMAGTAVLADDNVGSVLTRVDNLLREAQARGANQFSWDASGARQNTMRTGQAWVELLRQRIEDRALTLTHQPVVAELGGVPLQKEVYVRLKDEDGVEMNAGVFLPVIEQFDLGAQLDLAVLDKMLDEVGETPEALNVSLSAMRDTAFLSRLAAMTPKQAQRIYIEFPETHLQREPEAVASFGSILHSVGLRFGIDNVASGEVALDYIAQLRPHYVKVAPALCRAGDDASITMITSVCNTVHNLGIPVYATVVEDEAQLSGLQKTGIDGFQGYINGKVAAAKPSESVR